MSENDWESYDEADDNASESGSVGSLYDGHEIENGLVIGPVEIWKPVVTLKFKAPEASKSKPTEPETKNKETKPQNSCKVCKEENLKHYTCAHCNSLFYKRLGLTAHLKKHKRPKNMCKICKKEFLFPFKLQQHMIKHSNDRPFACDICNKSFKRDSTLFTHKNIHEKRKYKCEYCSKQFATKSNMQIHSRTHTGEKPYKCKKCSREFSQQTSLNNHLLKHKGIKPHQCEFCKEAFRQVCHLKKHLATKHSDETVNNSKKEKVRKDPNKKVVEKRNNKENKQELCLVWFSCKLCKTSFSSSNDLSKHMKLSHG